MLVIKSIVITGATSFIGVHVIKECLNKNYEVYAVARPNSSNLSCLPENTNVHLVEFEIGDYDKLVASIGSADSFIH